MARGTQAQKSAFGARLRELRVHAGFSQEELGDLAGVDRTYVSSCERGRRNVSLSTIYAFSEALGVESFQLLVAGKRGNVKAGAKRKR